MSKTLYPLLLLCCCLTVGQSQIAISGVINDYAAVVSLADADCYNGLEVDDVSPFSLGDRALLIQMNGALIRQTNDRLFGNVSDLRSTGLFEIVVVDSISNNSIYFRDSLVNTYDDMAIQQLVRIPQYTDARVTAPLTAKPWDGNTGGVLILEATGDLFVQANIDVTGLGFRGAQGSRSGGGPCVNDYFLPSNSRVAGRKGEGIAILDPSMQNARGKAANAGGGGNMHNGGGGGGAGFGDGGKGGDACLQCCGAASSDRGGQGGQRQGNQSRRLFMGGGGGQGHINDNTNLRGGNGGGILIMRADQILMQGGRVMANGENGQSSGANDFPTDGHPGGGGGGSVLLDANVIAGIPVFEAWGGSGGNNNTIGSEGPGGGGGGGVVIDRQNVLPPLSAVIVNGGEAGTSNGGFGRNHGAADGRTGGRATNFLIPEASAPFELLKELELFVNNQDPCSGDTLEFTAVTDLQNPNIQFSWSGPGLGNPTSADLEVPIVNTAQSGRYTLEASLGCQTIQQSIDIRVLPEYDLLIDTFICEGEQYEMGGQIYTNSGFYQADLQTAMGCDSMVQLDLTVIPPFYDTTRIQLCQGDTYDGDTYTRDTLLLASLSSSIGCDSFEYTSITVYPTYDQILYPEICAGEQFRGQTFFRDTVLVDNNQSAFGCDSLTTFELTVYPVYDEVRQEEICQGETFRGVVYNRDAVIVDQLQTNQGCDSTITIELTVYPEYDMANSVELCAGESYEGTTYYASETVVNTYSTFAGCDSTVTTDITVHPVYEQVFDLEICSGEQFNGIIYTEDTVLVDNNQTAQGCDSISTFYLRVHPVYDLQVSASVCTGESFRGVVFDRDTILVDNLQTVQGCDSTVTTYLTVHPAYDLQESIELCSGESYLGVVYRNSTQVVNNYLTRAGCDSTVTTAITVYPTYDETTLVEICSGETFGGQIMRADTVLVQSLLTSRGCDSILRTAVTVHPLPNPSINTSAGSFCESDEIQLSLTSPEQVIRWSTGDTSFQIDINSGGSYEVTVTNDFGCTASASIDIPDAVRIDAAIASENPDCFGEETGRITVDTVSGGLPPYVYALNDAPFSPNRVWSGLTAGQYRLTIQDANGCEQEEILVITTPPPIAISLSSQTDFELALGDSLALEAQVNQALDSIRWFPAAGINCDTCLAVRFSPQQTTDYVLEVVNASGCTASTKIRITVDERADVFAPNVFSPNGDGMNDGFTLFAGPAVVAIDRLLIMDRWGAVIFDRRNIPPNEESLGWDGMKNGERASPGVFVFHAELLLVNGRKTVINGDVTLLR